MFKQFHFKAVLLTAFAAITGLYAASSDYNFKKSLRKVISEYNYTFSEANPEYNSPAYEQMISYLTDMGVRSKYFLLREYFKIDDLRKMFNTPVFISGPHKDGRLNFSSQTSFGHYNTSFIEKLNLQLTRLLKQKSFRKPAQKLYDRHLKNLARQTYLAYHFVKAHPQRENIIATYKNYMKNAESCESYKCEPGHYLSGEFKHLSFSPSDIKGFNYYEGPVMAGFWVRREIDGTSDAFYALLVNVMQLFDDGF